MAPPWTLAGEGLILVCEKQRGRTDELRPLESIYYFFFRERAFFMISWWQVGTTVATKLILQSIGVW